MKPIVLLQDLSPEGAHLCLGLEHFIRQELGLQIQGKKILIAFSGGVDSTGLALFCRLMQDRWQSTTLAAHLDHNLRSESALQAKKARENLAKLDIPCISGSTQVKTYGARLGFGLEEASRRLRYRFLQGVRKKTGADLLFTGHHLNDLAEDSLLRQVRGTGWPALAGMVGWNPETSLLRPFLLTPKAKLVRFVRECGMAWQEDPSNQDLRYTRNRIRHQVLPSLLQENPNYLECVANLWRQAHFDHRFWTKELTRLRGFEHRSPGQIILFKQGLATSDPATRLRWYKDTLDRLGPGQARSSSLFNLDRAWRQQSSGKTHTFPGKKQALISQEGIRFSLCPSPGNSHR